MLNNAAILYEWDDNRKDIEKAKSLFRKAKTHLRIVENEDGNAIQHWREVANSGYLRIREFQCNETQVNMRFIQKDGDKTVCWDANVKNEVIEAAKTFQKHLGEGWIAYAVDPISGEKGHRIQEFNAEKEEIVFAEGPRMKLKAFAKKFKKVVVTAKTYPG